MKKIPTLFVREFETYKVTDEVTPGCEWVLAGEGIPTRKLDGTCMKLDTDGRWWARREVKPDKKAPPSFQLEEADPFTGKLFGWEPVEQTGWYKQFRDALEHDESLWEEIVILDPDEPHTSVGTYELCGPKVNGNPEKLEVHKLLRHGRTWLMPMMDEADPKGLVKIVADLGWEGIVWHHKTDDRMAKLKVRDLP